MWTRHAGRCRPTLRTYSGGQSTTTEPSGSIATSSRSGLLTEVPQHQNATKFPSFTRSSGQASATSSEPVTTSHRQDYIRNLVGRRPREQSNWPYKTHVRAEEPSPSEVFNSVVTSEFSAPSTTGYPNYYSEDMDNESRNDSLQPWETSEPHKSDSVVGSSKDSILSSVSQAHKPSIATRAAFAATALFLLSTTAVVAFYSHGPYSHKESAQKASSADSFEPTSIYHAAFRVHRKTVSTEPSLAMATAHDAGNLGIRAEKADNTPPPFAGEEDLGRATADAPQRPKKVAVWEGKRIYDVESTRSPLESKSTAGREEAMKGTQYTHLAKAVPRVYSTGVTQPAHRTPRRDTSYTVESTARRRTRTRVSLSNRNAKSCETKVCERESVYLISYLDWSAKPCNDFYEFVCGHWKNLHPEIGASVDTLLVRRVEEDIYQALTNDDKPRGLMPNTEALMNMCVHKPFSEDHTSTLLDFLGDLGLRGWPFQKDTKTLADVWKAASLLLRNLGLDTLVSVSVDANPDSDDEYIISLGEPSLLIGQYGTKDSQLPEWYNMAISTCFKTFTSGKYTEIAKRVRDFSSRLAEISINRGNEMFSANKFTVVQLKHHSNMIQLLTLVFNNITVVHSKLKVLVKSDVYLKELRSVLHVSKGADILNYLGFRTLVHISPLLPDQAVQLAAIQMREITGLYHSNWPRWRRCLRMFERVAPTVFLLAYAQTNRKLGNKDKLWTLLNEIQASFVSNINSAPWMSIEDKVMMKDKLSMLKLEMFHKFWSRFKNRKRAAGEFLPDFTSGSVIITYKSMAKQLVARKLSKIKLRRSSQITEWKGSVFDTDPVFDRDSNSIFIPMAMFDPSYMIDSESMLLQLPRVATKIIGALFQGIHQRNFPSGAVRWSVDTELGYHDVQKCLQKHYENNTVGKIRTQITTQSNILDSMAVLPAFKLFLKKVNKVNIEDYGVLTGLNITVKQLFFVLYAKGLCETMDSERKREVTEESALNIGGLRVNGPLRNSFRFPTFWECSSDSPMNPDQKCTIWTS